MKHLAAATALLLCALLGACTTNSLNLENPLADVDFDLDLPKLDLPEFDIPLIGDRDDAPVSESEPNDPNAEVSGNPLAETSSPNPKPALSMRAGGDSVDLPYTWDEVESAPPPNSSSLLPASGESLLTSEPASSSSPSPSAASEPPASGPFSSRERPSLLQRLAGRNESR